jgi:putative tryptophan/tyrosine transport system substrate-binding protein
MNDKHISRLNDARDRIMRCFVYVALTISIGFLCCVPPLNAEETKKLPRIGVLWGLDVAESAPYHKGFAEAMRDRGWVEGSNAQFIVRYLKGDLARVPAIVNELVSLKVDVLYLLDSSVAAARSQTSTIPILCVDFYDPIEEGFTSKLSRPDQNITGISYQTAESIGKRLELAKDLRKL